jgi:FkbM family methyltransferase
MHNIKNLIKRILLVFGISFFAKEKIDLFNKNLRLILFGEISSHFNSYDFNFFKNSKSQIMQDYFVASHFKFKKNGVFIEFGATDGIKDSNTYNLEKNYSWSGVLVEPIKSFYNELKKNRTSTCLNNVVYSENGKELIFQENSVKELSTIKGYEDYDRHRRGSNELNEYKVTSITLEKIFDDYLKTYEIDYLSIDTEGSEYEILKNFNFKKYKINVITVEHNYSINRLKINTLLIQRGYTQVLKNLSFWDDYYVLD